MTASFASSSIINGSCDLLLASQSRTVLSYEALAYIPSPAPPPTPPPHESSTSPPPPPRHVTYSIRAAWPHHFLIAWAVIRSVANRVLSDAESSTVEDRFVATEWTGCTCPSA